MRQLFAYAIQKRTLIMTLFQFWQSSVAFIHGAFCLQSVQCICLLPDHVFLLGFLSGGDNTGGSSIFLIHTHFWSFLQMRSPKVVSRAFCSVMVRSDFPPNSSHTPNWNEPKQTEWNTWLCFGRQDCCQRMAPLPPFGVPTNFRSDRFYSEKRVRLVSEYNQP